MRIERRGEIMEDKRVSPEYIQTSSGRLTHIGPSARIFSSECKTERIEPPSSLRGGMSGKMPFLRTLKIEARRPTREDLYQGGLAHLSLGRDH